MRGETNWRLPELQAAIAKKAATPLTALLALNAGEFRSKNESLHYAESRYFCKFLEERGILATVYRSFRDRFAKDPTGRLFVEQAFGQPLARVEAEWHTWLQTQTWETR